MHLTLEQARTLHLAAQGLAAPPRKPATRVDLARCIRRMQLLQIDTIHVVNRSPYLVLFARLGAYPTEWLEQLLARGTIFETWAHEACFAPIEDWALHRGYNAERAHWGTRNAQRAYRSHRTHMHTLLEHIRTQGAVKSSDFERTDGQGGGWWGWKSEKRWLEAWFALGELMVARRENFQRVYDLTERVHPTAARLPLPDAQAAQAQMTERAVKALGITQARWVNDYFRTKPKLKDRDLAPLLDAGVIERVQIENWREPAYVHREHLALARKVLRGALAATHTTLLS
ncbi:MAG TPA: crosslink repair DNA glycosylase YcaQ family protein, partial [Burkholderiaceae bacterium]|nr:crosslink repair DNA glycosylase YcaQ family protein [Burkholderiaceae bacterium]